MTSRLVLTPVDLGDTEDLALLYAHPQVAFWTGPWDRAAIETWASGMAAR